MTFLNAMFLPKNEIYKNNIKKYACLYSLTANSHLNVFAQNSFFTQ